MFPQLQQVATLLAAQTEGPAGCPRADILLPIVMFAILYLVWIRPASRERKQQAEMNQALKRGDQVVTSSGIIATISDIEEKIITLEISRNVKMRVLRSAIAKRLDEAEAKGEKDKAPETPSKSSKS